MVVSEPYRPILDKLGLSSLDQVRLFQGELVKNHRGRRDIVRIETRDASGTPVVLFLKRILRPYRKDGLRSLLRCGRVRSASRQEWDNSRLLLAHRIPVAEPVAYGEVCGLLHETFSFFITRQAPGSVTLEQFLRTCPDPRTRRSVALELARLVRRLHDAGLASPDLLGRHIFVDLQADPPRLCLIDMARLDQARTTSLRRRARDLAALHVSIPQGAASTRERLWFLAQYGKSDLPKARLVRYVERRSGRLLRRRRHHRTFHDSHLSPLHTPTSD